MNQQTSRSCNCFSYLLVFAATAIAWAPLCRRYVPVADDLYISHLLNNGVVYYFRHVLAGEFGIWRSAGVFLGALGTRHQLAFGPVVLLAHALVVCLFLRVLRELIGGTWLPIILALTFGVTPIAAGAVVWAAAANLVVMEGMFMITLLVLLQFGTDPRRQLICLVTTFILTFATQLVQENLLFTFAALPALLWIPEGKISWRAFRPSILRRYGGLGPLLGAGVFLIGWKLFPGTHPVKSTHFHPLSAISPYLRQYAVLWTFEPWRNAITRGLLFRDWSWPMTVIGAIGTLIATYAIWNIAPGKFNGAEERTARPTLRLLVVLLLLAAGASAIYAAAGGFSTDSRKQYALFPQTLLVVGWIVRRINVGRMPHARRWGAGLAAGVILIGTPSTWLYENIWHYQCARQAALVDYVIAHHFHEPVRINWVPDIYKAWPHAAAVWEFRTDEQWILNLEFNERGYPPIIRDDNADLSLYYDPKTDAWSAIYVNDRG